MLILRSSKKIYVFISAIFLIIFLAFAVVHAAEISNDDFDSLTAFTGLPYSSQQDISAASTALDDPLIAACGLGQASNSVWYSYTPSINSDITIDTQGSDYDTVVAVWTGSRGSLSLVACNNDDPRGGTHSALDISVSANTTYYIEVARAAPGGGNNLFLNVEYFFDKNETKV